MKTCYQLNKISWTSKVSWKSSLME